LRVDQRQPVRHDLDIDASSKSVVDTIQRGGLQIAATGAGIYSSFALVGTTLPAAT
jgi:hypothetical protein